AAEFKDMKASDWYAEAVGRLYGLRIIDGLPGGLFGPKNEVTRSQFVKMLVQAMNYQKNDSVSFDDIYVPTAQKSHWASVYIETALRNGVISKEETGRYFYPDVPLKRSDMFMMMFRALKLEPSAGANPFTDLIEANGSFTKLYEEYLSRGIVEDGKRLFKPFGHTTRAEAAVVIARMLDYREDPKGFVARMGMEERFVYGTQTTEDIALKRELEIAKAKADPNYIMEPQIRVLNTLKDFEGYGEDAEDMYNYLAGHIALDNFADYLEFSPECQFKIVCITKSKDLLNTVTWLTQPFISYDHVHEVRTDAWKPTKDVSVFNKELRACSIMPITRDEEKAENGKWSKVSNYVKAGETLNFNLYIKRGVSINKYGITFKVN
ncbi:MAG TPA: S-layer homology domain-containing protein, partial [Candidatus Nitrosocosmicus sp.]|nr:S-layer homology domain-containing protein [Candidatus Nitrosocosmicus sp.]